MSNTASTERTHRIAVLLDAEELELLAAVMARLQSTRPGVMVTRPDAIRAALRAVATDSVLA